MDENIVALGMSLAEVVSKNTVSYISSKMKLAKEKKDLESQSLAYTEIINSLLDDKEQLTLIAKEYKQAYEQITISDNDIEYLHKTLKTAIQILIHFSSETSASQESLNSLIELLNKDTLKTMQLLGFNYKEAIGQPLTEACANAIKNKLQPSKNKQNPNKK